MFGWLYHFERRILQLGLTARVSGLGKTSLRSQTVAYPSNDAKVQHGNQ
jgi:hypothetical protein